MPSPRPSRPPTLASTRRSTAKSSASPLPDLSQERREELVKVARKITEDGRVAVRHIRRDAMEGLKKSAKEAGVSEDEIKGAEKQVQKLTDDCIKKLDAHLANKENEILTV